jgi:hypothetical protein
MHFIKAGLIFAILFPITALAQISGDVESIGFEGYCRPDA